MGLHAAVDAASRPGGRLISVPPLPKHSFCHENMAAILNTPTNLSCINSKLMLRCVLSWCGAAVGLSDRGVEVGPLGSRPVEPSGRRLLFLCFLFFFSFFLFFLVILSSMPCPTSLFRAPHPIAAAQPWHVLPQACTAVHARRACFAGRQTRQNPQVRP